MNDKVCTYCNKTSHRAHRCPTRLRAFPLRGRDLFWATLLVALVAVASRLGLEFGRA